MGFIYKISCNKTNKIYIGQTTQTIDERWYEHKYSSTTYMKWKNGDYKPNNWRGTSSYLYKAMCKYGISEFSVAQLIEIPDNELDSFEKFYIQHLNTLAPNGYNLTTGGGHFKHCEKTKKVISEKVRGIMLSNIDNFRTSEKTKGLPPYVAYKQSGTYEAYYVNNHPLCKRKYFSSKTHGSIEEAKIAIVRFMEVLETNKTTHQPTNNSGLPKGLRKLNNGYLVRKTHNKLYYEKLFTDKKLTIDQNKQNAIEYLKQITQNNCPETKC